MGSWWVTANYGLVEGILNLSKCLMWLINISVSPFTTQRGRVEPLPTIFAWPLSLVGVCIWRSGVMRLKRRFKLG